MILHDKKWDLARFAVMRSLWLEVSPKLRAVLLTLISEEKKMLVHFYFHGEISEDDLESVQISETEAACGISDIGYGTEFKAFRCDYPEKIKLFESKQWTTIYARREKYPEDII